MASEPLREEWFVYSGKFNQAGVAELADATDSKFIKSRFRGGALGSFKSPPSQYSWGFAAAKRVFMRVEIGTPKP